jgi:hypothetical protein
VGVLCIFFFSPFRFSSYSFSLFLGWVMTLCVYVVWYVSFFLASLFCSFLSFYYLSSYTFLECPHFNDMMSCTWMARMGYVVFSCLMVTLQLWEASSLLGGGRSHDGNCGNRREVLCTTYHMASKYTQP